MDIDKALQEDPSIYEYDEVYDKMQASKPQVGFVAKDKGKPDRKVGCKFLCYKLMSLIDVTPPTIVSHLTLPFNLRRMDVCHFAEIDQGCGANGQARPCGTCFFTRVFFAEKI